MPLSGGHPEILCDTCQRFHPGHRSHISLWKDQDKVFLANFGKKVKISFLFFKKKKSHWHISHNQILNLFLQILTTNINVFLLTPFKNNKQVINCIFVAIKYFYAVTDKMKKNSKRNDSQNPHEALEGLERHWEAERVNDKPDFVDSLWEPLPIGRRRWGCPGRK